MINDCIEITDIFRDGYEIADIEANLKLIKNSNSIILKKISSKNIVNSYRYLSNELRTQNPITDEYRKVFQTGFKVISWDKGYSTKFFDYLEANKNSGKNIQQIFDDWYPNYTNTTKTNFSEIAKLSHFISGGETPLYDSTIRDFFMLKDLGNNVPNRDKLFFEQLKFVQCVYNKIENESKANSKSVYNFSKIINKFRIHFYVQPHEYSDIKIIDTLIWNK